MTMHSEVGQGVEGMGPLAAAAWETYLRDHFHARTESCRTPPHEAAARSEGSCPESTHDMEVRPPTGPVSNPPAGPLMDVAPPNILNTRVAALPAQSARVAALTAQSARVASCPDSTAYTGRAALTARPMGIDTRIAAQTERPESSHKGVWGRIRQGVESLAGTVRQAAQRMRTRWAEVSNTIGRMTLPNPLNICLVLSWLAVTELGNLRESII